MSKTRLFEAIKTADFRETKRILDAKPELLKVWKARLKASRKRNKWRERRDRDSLNRLYNN